MMLTFSRQRWGSPPAVRSLYRFCLIIKRHIRLCFDVFVHGVVELETTAGEKSSEVADDAFKIGFGGFLIRLLIRFRCFQLHIFSRL